MSRRAGGRDRRFSGAAPSFVPRALPNILAWYRSDQGVTIATGVSQWNDISGNNNNLTQGTGAAQPTLTASNASFNNRPTIASTGTQGLTATLTTTEPFTVWYVGTLAASGTMISNQATTWYSNDTGANTGITSGVAAAVGPRALTGANSIVAIAGTSGQVWVNQHTGGTVVNTGLTGGTSIFVLNGSTLAQGGNTLAELAIWSRALTQAEIDALNTYAHNRYGITIGA